MKSPKFFIKSTRFYFIAFLIAATLLLTFTNLSLYSEGQKIHQQALQKSQTEAKIELNKIIQYAIQHIKDEALELSEWDEIHQQFHNPLYYFFWRDQRFRETEYFKPYYDGLELYGKNKELLMRESADQSNSEYLPVKIPEHSMTLSQHHDETHLNLYQTVKNRKTGEIIGYIGLTLDLIPFLTKSHTFNKVNPNSIEFTRKITGEIPYQNLVENLDYSPVTNPVSDFLWKLIQDFILKLIVLMFIVILVISFLFNIAIYRPINLISHYLHQLKQSPYKKHNLPNKVFMLKEFEELKNSIYQYHSNLQSAQVKLDEQNQIVWDQARRDVLTNIYNRRAFDETWNEVINLYKTDDIPVVFMLFDCDFFKALNDTYGHEVGDQVIKLTASTIQKVLPIDAPPYRIGGDEFAIILPHRTTDDTINIANRCLQALDEQAFNALGIKEKLTFSVGISNTLDDLENDVTNLPRQADIAMYKAKQSLKEKVQCYHLDLEKESMSLVSKHISNIVVDAVHHGNNIQMHYQPIQSLESASLYYESLIRIKDDDQLILPNDIFSVVNLRRLEMEIDHQVIEQVYNALADSYIPENTGVSINISAKTLLQPSFTEMFKRFIPFLNNYKIVIEITENSLIDHLEYANRVLNNLRNDGFLIALDDFGSGYSSIRYLAHMPVDIIKFDMSMLQALMHNDEKTQNIIKTTAKMILDAGYDLVLEGIETQEMLELSKSIGATHIQGYLLGKPSSTPKEFTHN